MTLGQRIKELREEKSLTQEELGKIINISKASLSKYEADIIQPNTETIKFLATFFNVTTDYLLGISNIRSNTNIRLKEINEKIIAMSDNDLTKLKSLIDIWTKEDNEKKEK